MDTHSKTTVKASSLSLWSILLALSVAIIWGLNFVMVKIGLEQIQPLTLCALRFLLASVPAIFLVPKPDAPWKYIVGYGLLTFAIQFSLIFAGMAAGVSASVAALIVQSQVFFAIFFTCILVKQTLNVWQIAGGIISFAGIGVIALHRNLDCTLLGLALLLASSVSWGLGNVISVKLKSVNMFSLVVWSSFIAFIPLSVAALLFESPMQVILHPQQLARSSLFALFYITFASTHFGYGVWSWLVSKYPTASIAPFALLCPIVAMFSSSFILDESIELWKILSALLVTTGLCINIFGKKLYLWSNTLFFADTDRAVVK